MSEERSSRFRKGQSGNPKGRPKKKVPPPASAFDVILEQRLAVMQNGEERDLTVDEALQLRTYQDALAGNKAARSKILKMILQREIWLQQHRSTQMRQRRPVSYTVADDPQNANAALLLLGIATYDERWHGNAHGDERLLLEAWAVKAALRRGRNIRIADKDHRVVQNSLRGGQDIVWP